MGNPILNGLVDETYTALNNDARVLAAIGMPTIFDRVSELLGVDPALTFAEKLVELQGLGKIGQSDKEHLELLTNAGNAAAHQAWKPTYGSSIL